MRSLAIAAFSLACTATSPAADEVVTSPRGTFTIAQHHEGNWTTKLRFTKSGRPDITFSDEYQWPGLFYVSPDDQWILHVQKSGFGENISILYRLDSVGRLWRIEQRFGNLAFAYLERTHGVRLADLHHTGIEFGAWDLGAGVMRFTVRGSSTKHSGEGVSRELIYDLQKHTFRNP